jgi:hypothetical protein
MLLKLIRYPRNQRKLAEIAVLVFLRAFSCMFLETSIFNSTRLPMAGRQLRMIQSFPSASSLLICIHVLSFLGSARRDTAALLFAVTFVPGAFPPLLFPGGDSQQGRSVDRFFPETVNQYPTLQATHPCGSHEPNGRPIDVDPFISVFSAASIPLPIVLRLQTLDECSELPPQFVAEAEELYANCLLFAKRLIVVRGEVEEDSDNSRAELWDRVEECMPRSSAIAPSGSMES